MSDSTERHGVTRARRVRTRDGMTELGSLETTRVGFLIHFVDPDGIDSLIERDARPQRVWYPSIEHAVHDGWEVWV